MLYEFILYVADQPRARDFYAHVLRREPVLDVPGMTEFQLTDTVKLGLMPNDGIARILAGKTPHPSIGFGVPRCELYVYTETPESDLEGALNAGAALISSVEDRDWGDRAGYVADPDGHVVAFAKRLNG